MQAEEEEEMAETEKETRKTKPIKKESTKKKRKRTSFGTRSKRQKKNKQQPTKKYKTRSSHIKEETEEEETEVNSAILASIHKPPLFSADEVGVRFFTYNCERSHPVNFIKHGKTGNWLIAGIQDALDLAVTTGHLNVEEPGQWVQMLFSSARYFSKFPAMEVALAYPSSTKKMMELTPPPAKGNKKEGDDIKRLEECGSSSLFELYLPCGIPLRDGLDWSKCPAKDVQTVGEGGEDERLNLHIAGRWLPIPCDPWRNDACGPTTATRPIARLRQALSDDFPAVLFKLIVGYLEPESLDEKEKMNRTHKWWPWAIHGNARSPSDGSAVFSPHTMTACRAIRFRFRIHNNAKPWRSENAFLEDCAQDTIQRYISDTFEEPGKTKHPNGHVPIGRPGYGVDVTGPGRSWSMGMEMNTGSINVPIYVGTFPIDSDLLDDAYCTWRMILNDVLCSNDSRGTVSVADRRRLLMKCETIDLTITPIPPSPAIQLPLSSTQLSRLPASHRQQDSTALQALAVAASDASASDSSPSSSSSDNGDKKHTKKKKKTSKHKAARVRIAMPVGLPIGSERVLLTDRIFPRRTTKAADTLIKKHILPLIKDTELVLDLSANELYLPSGLPLTMGGINLHRSSGLEWPKKGPIDLTLAPCWKHYTSSSPFFGGMKDPQVNFSLAQRNLLLTCTPFHVRLPEGPKIVDLIMEYAKGLYFCLFVCLVLFFAFAYLFGVCLLCSGSTSASQNQCRRKSVSSMVE